MTALDAMPAGIVIGSFALGFMTCSIWVWNLKQALALQKYWTDTFSNREVDTFMKLFSARQELAALRRETAARPALLTSPK